jgi:hypothetical protein
LNPFDFRILDFESILGRRQKPVVGVRSFVAEMAASKTGSLKRGWEKPGPVFLKRQRAPF